MTAEQRNEIENLIQKLEAGRFQELMLRFLPLYDKQYEGMIRNGHNTDGKTTKGIPDLIKTSNDGGQIACECGTQKDYWKIKGDCNNSKPIKDFANCLKNLSNPIEIILACSQSVPPTSINIFSEIKKICSNMNENCKVEVFSSADMSSWIEKNKKNTDVSELIKEFFPNILISNIIDIITGTNSYCYLQLHSIKENVGTVLIHNPGDYALEILQVGVVDDESSTKQSILNYNMSISPNATWVDRDQTKRWDLGNRNERRFNIFWTLKNGHFTQILIFKRTSDGWRYTTTVKKMMEKEILYKHTQPGFPIIENVG